MSWDSLLLFKLDTPIRQLTRPLFNECDSSRKSDSIKKVWKKLDVFLDTDNRIDRHLEWQKTFWTPLITLLTLCDVGPNDTRLVWFLEPSSVSTATTLHSAQMTLECQGEPNWCLLNCYRVVNRYLYLSIEEIILVFKMAKEERAIEIEDPWS